MEKLIILDYATGTVHFYDIDPSVDINDEFIESLGFKESETLWMCVEDLTLTFHKEALK